MILLDNSTSSNSSTSLCSSASLSLSTLDTSVDKDKTPSLATPIKNLNLLTPENSKKDNNPKTDVCPVFKSPGCKKQLSFETPETPKTPKKSPKKRPKFDLPTIYTQLYGERPVDSHTAESDVLTLLSSAIRSGPEFLDLVDQLADTFDSVPKAW